MKPPPRGRLHIACWSIVFYKKTPLQDMPFVDPSGFQMVVPKEDPRVREMEEGKRWHVIVLAPPTAEVAIRAGYRMLQRGGFLRPGRI